jgi:hypothetical protein
MDFLDPKKQKAHKIRLFIGYFLVGIALILTTIILLYQAYGFGVDKHGQVIQNGLVFVSSTPGPANIYLNGKLKDATNTRMFLPAGQYTFEVNRDGYRNWKRAVTVEGGSVEHFDYPFLFPTKLASTATKKYAAQPGLVLQTPDRRWLLAQTPEAFNKFDMFDLNAKKPADTLKTITIPENLLATFSGSNGSAQNWEFEEWSTDNRHVLLKHLFQKDGQTSSEYIIVDRTEPTQSLNLTSTLGVTPSKIELRDKKYDQYYLYDQAIGALTTATLKEPTPKAYLEHVLDFKSHGSDVMLYATSQGAPAGKTIIKLREGDKTYNIRTVTAGSQYLLNLTQYSGDWLVAVGAPVEGKVYVYQNPAAALGNKPDDVLVPVGVLKVPGANYLSFSDNARFIMTENGDHFAVYDAENDKSYAYHTKHALDAPQTHATWMDGHRLTYVSGGKVIAFDFDSVNLQTLEAADPAIVPLYDQNYKFLYTFTTQPATGATPAQPALTSTSLRTTQDQ